MSDTPRTDAATGIILNADCVHPQEFARDRDGCYVHAKFARDLERALWRAVYLAVNYGFDQSFELSGTKEWPEICGALGMKADATNEEINKAAEAVLKA
jgi:hypothetical protein